MKPAQRALVVDDSDDWRAEIKEMLQDYGFAVVTAGDKQSALFELEKQTFNLAIIDVNLTDETPNADGLLISRYIQENAPATSVVVISAESYSPSVLAPARFFEKSEIPYQLRPFLEQEWPS